MSWLVIYKTKYSKQVKKQFEDIKGGIRIRRSKKDNTMTKRYQRGNQNTQIEERQHNDQKKKGKRTNNDLQNITHKTKD